MNFTTAKILAPVMAFMLLTLVACSKSTAPGSGATQPPPSSGVPSGISSSEQQSRPASSEGTKLSGDDGPFQAFADELRDIYRDELIALLNQWLGEHRNGTFEEMPNHHPAYPPDFPPAAELPEIESIEDIMIVYKESAQIDANTELEGFVRIVVPIDEAHIYILDPAKFFDENGNISIGFGYSGFADMSAEDFIAQTEAHVLPDAEQR